MKNTRKASTLKQAKRLTEAYAGIFRGLYWRHEFARRNEAVSNASRDLAKALGFKPERFEHFIQDAHPLTDELVHICKAGTQTAKSALGKFLDIYKVFPTTWTRHSKAPYFPMEFGLDDRGRENYVFDTLANCRMLFNNFLLFEAFSMSDLSLGHPVMFPLMPLVVFGKKIEQLHLDDFPAPVLLDRFVPVELIGHYSDAFDFEMEWGRYKKNREKSNNTPEKSTKKTDKEKDASTKVPWDSLAAYIRIYDHSLITKDEKKTSAKYGYYLEYMNPEDRPKPAKDLVANAFSSYGSQLESAMRLIENYQDII